MDALDCVSCPNDSSAWNRTGRNWPDISFSPIKMSFRRLVEIYSSRRENKKKTKMEKIQEKNQ